MGCKASSRSGKASLSTLFYLDYVGCKVDFYSLVVYNVICFISTMWDVKTYSRIKPFPLHLCFISTMWDVKINVVL